MLCTSELMLNPGDNRRETQRMLGIHGVGILPLDFLLSVFFWVFIWTAQGVTR
jgi:hypothetical protein